ncbi:unnamed protein product [Schistosoma curassoni]|nr:unnamed protein product [Schistosoma curassoni]
MQSEDGALLFFSSSSIYYVLSSHRFCNTSPFTLFFQGYHVVTYVMGIFLLNRLIDFLSPKIVPETSTDEVLPTKSSEEFRPFLRKLPELKFWYDDFFVDYSLTGTHVPYVYLYLYSVHF